MSKFQKAQKSKSKLRLAITGSSGSGKTYTALAIASGLGKKIAVIDTENGSSSKYATIFPHDAANLSSFRVEDYLEVMRDAVNEKYDVVIIDSISPEWEQINNEKLELDNRFPANTWGNWAKIKPKHKKFVQEIISMPCHVICTMRTKTKYDDQVINGKKVKVKIGLEPIQQENIEYEFDMLLEMTLDHEGFVAKDRTDKFQDKMIEKPNKSFGEALHKWLNEGTDEKITYTEPAEPSKPAPSVEPSQPSVEMMTEKQKGFLNGLGKEIYGNEWKTEAFNLIKEITGKDKPADLTKVDAAKIIEKLNAYKALSTGSPVKSNGKAEYDKIIDILEDVKSLQDWNGNASKVGKLIEKITDEKLRKQAEEIIDGLVESLEDAYITESDEDRDKTDESLF